MSEGRVVLVCLACHGYEEVALAERYAGRYLGAWCDHCDRRTVHEAALLRSDDAGFKTLDFDTPQDAS